jgi:hypothetical protein
VISRRGSRRGRRSFVAIPGNDVPLKDFTVPATGQGRAVVFLFASQEDTFNVYVYPDGTQPFPGFTQNQMRVGFHKIVDTPKLVRIYSPDEQSFRILRLNNSWDPISWRSLSRLPDGTGDNLSFFKQDFWSGQLIAKYRFQIDEFWSAFGGKVLFFDWIKH